MATSLHVDLSDLPFKNLQELTSLRLSSHQVNLLLSSIWVQATSAENTPANFEAMAHTYNIALMFTRSKVRICMCLMPLHYPRL